MEHTAIHIDVWEELFMNKYRNIKAGGFDSRKEAARWQELRLLERAGVISDLKRQVPIELLPAQYVDGRCVERSVKYVADFTYTEHGKPVVEDVKSEITRKNKEYVIKRKLLLYIHGIRLKEV